MISQFKTYLVSKRTFVIPSIDFRTLNKKYHLRFFKSNFNLFCIKISKYLIVVPRCPIMRPVLSPGILITWKDESLNSPGLIVYTCYFHIPSYHFILPELYTGLIIFTSLVITLTSRINYTGLIIFISLVITLSSRIN